MFSELSPGKSTCLSVLAPREEAESGLEFLGLLVMENRLKQETKAVLQELAAAHIRSVMVTGNIRSVRVPGKTLRLLLWPHWLLQGTQERYSLLQHPPLHIRSLYLGWCCAMADRRNLPLSNPCRGQPADSCDGGQKCRYDSHRQQSYPR